MKKTFAVGFLCALMMNLSGCVVAPAGPGYYAGRPAYYAGPVYYHGGAYYQHRGWY
jgi:hypothetical protein